VPLQPKQTPFLTARWRNLVVINYEIDPQILLPLVPSGTELDSFQGKYFVSVVGFLFQQTKLFGLLPIVPFQTFEEINLRFYIKRIVGTEIRRAVCFVKEVVPHQTIAWTARTFYQEPYIALPTKHRWKWLDLTDTSKGGSFAYEWQVVGKHNYIEAKTQGSLQSLQEDTIESFILEHYWGYTKQRVGSTKEYQVWHPAWKFWNVTDFYQEIDVEYLYGKNFVNPFRNQPHSVQIAYGSEVAVYKGERCLLP
jgi:uncharacterized protein YqjF (DUF2071 family)